MGKFTGEIELTPLSTLITTLHDRVRQFVEEQVPEGYSVTSIEGESLTNYRPKQGTLVAPKLDYVLSFGTISFRVKATSLSGLQWVECVVYQRGNDELVMTDQTQITCSPYLQPRRKKKGRVAVK